MRARLCLCVCVCVCVCAQFTLTHAPLIGHFHACCNITKKGHCQEEWLGKQRESNPLEPLGQHTQLELELELGLLALPKPKPVTPLNDQLHLNSFNLI